MSETVTRIGKPYDENDPSTYRKLIWTTTDDKPVEVVVTPTQTKWVATSKSNVSEQPQLELANQREIDINKADDKVHKQFGAKSWGDFLASQALGTAAAFGGYAAYPILTSPYVTQPLNAYFTYQVGKDLVGENGIPKTYNYFKNGDYEAGAWSAAGDVANATLGTLGVSTAGNWLKNMGLRTLEVGMRNAENTNQIIKALNNTKVDFKDLLKFKNVKQNPLLRNLDYIVTGNKNHLTPIGSHGNRLYAGVHHNSGNVFSNTELPESDAITAYLYGDDLPKDLFTKIQTGGDLGIFNDYVAKNYSRVRDRIPTYEGGLFNKRGYQNPESIYGYVKLDEAVPKDTPKTILRVTGNTGELPSLKKHVTLDAGGYNVVWATDKDGRLMLQARDIWKFKPNEYLKRYAENDLLKKYLKYPLYLIDNIGTPFITQTPWQYVHPSAYEGLGYDVATRTFKDIVY